MKKLIIFFVIFILLGGSLLFFLKNTLDAQSYKTQIIQATQELTGRKMEVEGAVTVQLFPTPTITLNNVKIKNIPGSSTPDVVSIKKIIATVKWGSLFETPLTIETISLDTPSFFMERNEKGQVNWDFPFLREKIIKPEQDNLIGKSILEVPPQFKNLSIQNGRLIYTNTLTGFTQTFEQIKGTLTAPSINGPFQFNGYFSWHQKPIQISLTSGLLFSSQTADIKLVLVDPQSKAQINLTGNLKNLTQTNDITGNFSINVPKMAPFLKTIINYSHLPDSLERPLIGTSTFSFSSEKATFDDIAFRYGTSELENSISGSVSFVYPEKKGEKTHTQASLVLSKINLDTFLPLLPNKEDLKSQFLAFNRKTMSDIDLKIKANSVTYKKDILKETIIDITHKDETTKINQFKTVLPGDTQLTFAGEIDIIDNNSQSNLNISLAAQDIKKTIEWLNLPIMTKLSLDNLTTFKGSGELFLRETDFTLSKINAEANDGSITGSITLSLTEEKPTGIIQASFKNINLDNYISTDPKKEEQTFSQLWEEVQEEFQDSSFLSAANFQFDVTGRDITIRNIPIENLSATGLLQNEVLNIESLKVEGAAMANLTFSGTIQKQNNQLAFTNITYDFNTPKASVFLDRAMIISPLSEQLHNVSLSGVASGQADSFTFNTNMDFSQARIKAHGQIQQKNTIPNYDVFLSIDHPNFHQFMKLFNKDYTKFPYMTGSLNFQAQLKGTAQTFTLTEMDGMIGTQRFKGTVTVTNDIIRRIQANVTSSLFNFEKIYPKKDIIRGIDPNSGKAQFSDDLFNFGNFEGLDLDITASSDKMIFDKISLDLMSTHFTLKENLLTLEYLKGTLNDGSFSMEGTLNAGTAEPVIALRIQGENINLTPDNWALGRYRLKGGKSTFLMNLNTRGNSLKDMVHSLSANGKYTITDGLISGLNLNNIENQTKLILEKGQEADTFEDNLTTYLSMGETHFSSLSGSYTISDGILRTSDSIFQSPQSNALIQATINFPEWTVSSSIALSMKGFTSFPPIPIIITGLIHSPEVEPNTSSYVLYLTSASAQIRDIALRQKLERERKQATMEAQERKQEATKIASSSHAKIDETQKIIQIAPTPQGEKEFIRAQDALTLINELSIKETISKADLKKIEEQYTLLLQRTDLAQKASLDIALAKMRQQSQTIMTSAQTTINAITRIYQQLEGVESVDTAYKKGQEMFSIIEKLNTFIYQSQDPTKSSEALSHMQQALQMLENNYNAIAKFDVEGGSLSNQDNNKATPVQGKIIRNSAL